MVEQHKTAVFLALQLVVADCLSLSRQRADAVFQVVNLIFHRLPFKQNLLLYKDPLVYPMHLLTVVFLLAGQDPHHQFRPAVLSSMVLHHSLIHDILRHRHMAGQLSGVGKYQSLTDQKASHNAAEPGLLLIQGRTGSIILGQGQQINRGNPVLLDAGIDHALQILKYRLAHCLAFQEIGDALFREIGFDHALPGIFPLGVELENRIDLSRLPRKHHRGQKTFLQVIGFHMVLDCLDQYLVHLLHGSVKMLAEIIQDHTVAAPLPEHSVGEV